MQSTKNGLKDLIAQNRLEEAVEVLLKHTNLYLSENADDMPVSKISEALLINSGKLKGLIHDQNLGILSTEEAKITKAEVQKAILYVVDQLPEGVFHIEKILENKQEISKTEQSKLHEGVKLLKTELSDFEFDIFLSFSSKDRQAAKKVWEKLRGYGLRVFLSDEALKIDVGTSFTDKIQYALSNSQHYVLLSTPDAWESRYVQIETNTFFNEFFIKNEKNESRLIILRGKGFELEQLPPFYRTLQIADSVEQIVHSLIDKSVLEQKENEKKQQEEEALIQKRQKEFEAEKRRKQEELEQKALEEFEQKQKEGLEGKAAEEKLQRENELKKRKADWDICKKINSVNSYQEFVTLYKEGYYINEAKAEIEKIKAKQYESEEQKRKNEERIKKEQEKLEKEKKQTGLNKTDSSIINKSENQNEVRSKPKEIHIIKSGLLTIIISGTLPTILLFIIPITIIDDYGMLRMNGGINYIINNVIIALIAILISWFNWNKLLSINTLILSLIFGSSITTIASLIVSIDLHSLGGWEAITLNNSLTGFIIGVLFTIFCIYKLISKGNKRLFTF